MHALCEKTAGVQKTAARIMGGTTPVGGRKKKTVLPPREDTKRAPGELEYKICEKKRPPFRAYSKGLGGKSQKFYNGDLGGGGGGGGGVKSKKTEKKR